MTSTFKLFLLCFIIVFTEGVFLWLWVWQENKYKLNYLKDRKNFLNVKNIILLLFLLSFFVVFVLTDQNTALNWYVFWVFLLDLVLIFLSGKALFDFARLKSKKPVFTKKISALVFWGLAFELLLILVFASFQENAAFIFLLALLFEPLIISSMALGINKIWRQN